MDLDARLIAGQQNNSSRGMMMMVVVVIAVLRGRSLHHRTRHAAVAAMRIMMKWCARCRTGHAQNHSGSCG